MTNPAAYQTSLFDDLLAGSDDDNRRYVEEKRLARLPANRAEGIPYCRMLIERFDEAMRAGHPDQARQICEQAHDLAYKINGFESGILAGPDSAGCVLDRETAAPAGSLLLWGQSGTFDLPEFNARVEFDGFFGIGAPAPGFAVRVIDPALPFLSETGFRSFLGLCMLVKGSSPADFAADILRSYVARNLKGKLRRVQERRRSAV